MIIFVEIDIDGFQVKNIYGSNDGCHGVSFDLEIDDSAIEGMSDEQIDNYINKAVGDSFSYSWSKD